MGDEINETEIANGQDVVCILSARRTGSTLLQNILCQSPQTHAFVSEAQMLTRLLDAFQWGDSEFDRMVNAYFGSRESFWRYQKETVTGFILSARANLNAQKILILKNPELSLHTEKLTQLLPTARFLVLARDPRDQIASELAVSTRQLTQKMRGQMPSIQALCAAYDRYYAAIEQGRSKKPSLFLTIRYEDLVNHTKMTIKTIEEFLEIDLSAYNPAAAWQNVEVDWSKMKERPSWSEYYGKPLSNGPAGSFTEKLTPNQIEEIESRLSTWLHTFNYPRYDNANS